MPSIILIDDDASLRDLMRLHLSRKGMAVTACEDAATGIREMLRARPDLLVLDLTLPDLGGLQVLQAVRGDAATKTLPVVLLTARRDIDTISEARRLGANAFLIKPVRLDKLTTTIMDELAKPAAAKRN